jgi:hypothetical protein
MTREVRQNIKSHVSGFKLTGPRITIFSLVLVSSPLHVTLPGICVD